MVSPWGTWSTKSQARTMQLALVVVVVLVGASSCAHPRAHGTAAPRDERHLLALEDEFVAFTSTRLDVDDDGRPVDGTLALSRADAALAALERLRLRYLDLLRDDVVGETRVLALVRLGELHLDLGARIRRVPYPSEATRDEKLAFDAHLSRLALPLEATGFGMLEQALHVARVSGVAGPPVTRARLYLALHRDRAALDDTLIAALTDELMGRRAFAAPRRLLEGGRVGQRAARRGH